MISLVKRKSKKNTVSWLEKSDWKCPGRKPEKPDQNTRTFHCHMNQGTAVRSRDRKTNILYHQSP